MSTEIFDQPVKNSYKQQFQLVLPRAKIYKDCAEFFRPIMIGQEMLIGMFNILE